MDLLQRLTLFANCSTWHSHYVGLSSAILVLLSIVVTGLDSIISRTDDLYIEVNSGGIK